MKKFKITDMDGVRTCIYVIKGLEEKNGNEFSLDVSGKKYKLINEVNETTQAIAVAPLDKEGKPDYTQTTIVVAGTQAPDGDINNHVIESGLNAATARVQLTEQTKSISKSKWKVNKMIFML